MNRPTEASAPGAGTATGSALRRFRTTYVLALTLVAGLAVVGQVVIQRSLAAQVKSGEVINIAGRQRMLSQRLTKNALLMLQSPQQEEPFSGAETASRARRELRLDLERWEAAHERLARGDLASPELAVVTEETKTLLRAVDPEQAALATLLRQIVDGTTPEAAPLLDDILNAERRFLLLMDDLVFAYSRVAEARVAETRRIERILLALTLLVLFFEAVWVFRPMDHALRRSMRRLREGVAKLRRSEARFGRVVSGARDGFWDYRLSTETLEVSRRFREIWRLPLSGDVAWSTLASHVATSDRRRLRDWLESGTDGPVDLELRVRRDEGFAWVRLRGGPAGGDFVSGRLTDIDVERRVAAEQERLIAVQGARLQDADEVIHRAGTMRAVAGLASGLAHDFNNYLQVMRLELEWLRDVEGRRPRQAVRAIDDVTREASGLVRQLLTLSRSEVGLSLDPLRLNVTIEAMLPILRRATRDYEIAFRPGAELPELSANEAELRQVMINLVANARDAMSRGEERDPSSRGGERDASSPAIVVSTAAAAGTSEAFPEPTAGVMLTVTDAGEGMSEAVRQRVFEPFFTTKPIGKGTGLGLAMVQRIVARHRGSVRLSSAEGAGTTVEIWLPARSAEATSAAASAEADADAENDGSLVLLVVDDDPAILASLVRQLEADGHRVHRAASAETALENLDACVGLDVLITDVMLPRMLGPELADAVRDRLGSELPVLFISGYSSSQVDLSVPGTRLLAKPFSAEQLATELREIAGDASVGRQKFVRAASSAVTEAVDADKGSS
ncbi:MAG: ATP-binding protein [Myxococcota bacterium]